MIESLQETIRDLKRREALKVAVYIPEDCKLDEYGTYLYGIVKEFLEDQEDKVEFINIDNVFLNSYEGMNLVDILFILEGEKVPTYYLRRIKDFLSKGRAVIVLSRSIPFMNLEEFEEQAGMTNYLLGGAPPNKDNFYRLTTAYMGLKIYTSDIRPTKAIYDRDFLPESPESTGFYFNDNGIYCNTSSEKYIPRPPYGNVFPERYEVLRNYVVVKGADEFGKHLTSSVVFTQNWENGSRMAFINLSGEERIPKECLLNILSNAVVFCFNKVVVSSVEPEYACYRDGESVKIKYEIANFSDSSVRVELNLEVGGELGDTLSKSKDIQITSKSNLKGEFCWFSKGFLSDFYTIRIKLIINGRVVSKAENGFVVWKDEVAYKKNNLDIQDRYFLHNDKSTVITGTNYYESHIGELMWVRPDINKLRNDLKAMADSGINYIRIHYHHPKWFINYLKYSIGQIPPYLEGICQSYLPDEKIWRIFDAHIYLCQKFGIIYGGDLLTLVPEEMGDPTGWIGVQDRIYLDEKMEAQKEFLRLLAKRYKNVQGIAWDLWNEPEELDTKGVLNWAKEMKKTLREEGDKHIVTIGTGRTSEYEEVVDFHSDHKNFKHILNTRYITSKPVIMQEVWLDRQQTLEGDREQAKDMFQALLDTFRIGLSGFSPWQWTNQARLWNDYRVTYHELWDDRLGCCVRNDGTLKPAGRIYRDFSILIKAINFSEYKEGKIYTDKGILEIFSSDGKRTNFGEAYLIHFNQAFTSLYAGIMKDAVVLGDRVYIEAKDNIIWFFTEDNKSIEQSRSFYVKTNSTGILKILKKGGIEGLNLELVDYTLDGWKTLSSIEFSQDKAFIEIQILPWYINYWIRVKF